MTAFVVALVADIVQAFTFASSVTLFAGVSPDTIEWYGGRCEWRPVELEIGGRWFEAQPRECP